MRLRKNPARIVVLAIAGLVLGLGLALGPGSVAAQGMAMTPHPAHIHSGSCDQLGDVVYPLTDVGGSSMATPMASPASGEMMGTPTSMAGEMAMGTPTGSPSPMAGETSVTTVEAALTDLTAGGYAINVHESAENIGNYIACGDISGAPNDSGDVTVELATLNDSGYSGTAKLHDNGDGTTTVTIELMHEGM
ncbi:MAG TPA: hypothetical protein VFP05_12965 [Thermomicrobiales bacterium]|nr:hypothetical protein [Thermomicrobiales bacterium]